MKKFVLVLITVSMLFSMLSVYTRAEGINLLAPTESEIAPTRDFYVVGTIDRGGKSASEMPLNIRINLVNSSGETVRSIESNVAPDGQTPGLYLFKEYENGVSKNENGGVFINTFSPPDIVFDGDDRESVRNAYNKIIVKENYFAAIIYGGATKDFDLNYVDKYEKGLSDITEGEYELVIVALDLFGEEVYRTKEKISVGNKVERLISSQDLSEYAKEENLSFPNSVVGFWDIGSLTNLKTNNFTYTVPARFFMNNSVEYGNSKKVSVLLNDIYLADSKMSSSLGSIFAEDSDCDVSYLYFDIGDKSVSFDFAGETFNIEASIEKSKYGEFIEICRAESVSEDFRVVDFNIQDGILFSGETRLYGVYSPVNPVSKADYDTYKITNDVNRIKTEITDLNGKVIYSEISPVGLLKQDEKYTSAFEFSVAITPDEKMLSLENLELKIYALDKDGEAVCESKTVPVRVIGEGVLISGYDDTYWGKVFCDTVNNYGDSPSGIPLNGDEHITRGDFATMVNRLLGYSVMGETKFADLKENSVFYNDCITAKEIGYMTGDEKGNVNANSLISREEAMIILARISGAEKGEKEIIFKDSDLISFWAKDYVDALCSAGIVSGFDGYINPKKNITVAEAAALIIKTVKWMYSDEDVLPVGEGNNFVVLEPVTDLSEVEITDVEFIDGLSEENISEFFRENSSAFSAVSEYFTDNFYENGVYVGKVGNGLEIRDYRKGNILTLSEEATKLIEKMSAYFVSFTIRYNTTKNTDIYFALGKDSENKEFGVVNTEKEEISGRELVPLAENWFYYIQK